MAENEVGVERRSHPKTFFTDRREQAMYSKTVGGDEGGVEVQVQDSRAPRHDAFSPRFRGSLSFRAFAPSCEILLLFIAFPRFLDSLSSIRTKTWAWPTSDESQDG